MRKLSGLEVRKNFSTERKKDKGITGLMLFLMLHWDRASLSSAGPGLPPLANCGSQLGRDSEDMVPVGCRVG